MKKISVMISILLVISFAINVRAINVYYPSCYSNLWSEERKWSYNIDSKDWSGRLDLLIKNPEDVYSKYVLNETLYLNIEINEKENGLIDNLNISFILVFPSNKSVIKNIVFDRMSLDRQEGKIITIGKLSEIGKYKTHLDAKWYKNGTKEKTYLLELPTFHVDMTMPCETRQYYTIQMDDFGENIKVSTVAEGCFKVRNVSLVEVYKVLPVHNFVIPYPNFSTHNVSLNDPGIKTELSNRINDSITPHSEGLCTISIGGKTEVYSPFRRRTTDIYLKSKPISTNNTYEINSYVEYTPLLQIPYPYSECYEEGEYIRSVNFSCSMIYNGVFLIKSSNAYPKDTYRIIFGFKFPERSFLDIDFKSPKGKVITEDFDLGFTNEDKILDGDFSVISKKEDMYTWRDFNTLSWRNLDVPSESIILGEVYSGSFLSPERAELIIKPFDIFLGYAHIITILTIVLSFSSFILYKTKHKNFGIKILNILPTSLLTAGLLTLFIGCVVSYVFNIFSMSRPTTGSSILDIKFKESVRFFEISLFLLLVVYTLQKLILTKQRDNERYNFSKKSEGWTRICSICAKRGEKGEMTNKTGRWTHKKCL